VPIPESDNIWSYDLESGQWQNIRPKNIIQDQDAAIQKLAGNKV
jgi:hypothetical protein